MKTVSMCNPGEKPKSRVCVFRVGSRHWAWSVTDIKTNTTFAGNNKLYPNRGSCVRDLRRAGQALIHEEWSGRGEKIIETPV